MSAIIQWPTRPIATLISQHSSGQAAWPLPYSHTLVARVFSNVLKIQIEFKYTKSYGGDAAYNIFIDRKVGSDWSNLIHDTVVFEAKDDVWKTAYKEYDLLVELPLFSIDETPFEFDFRVTAQIQLGGSINTGSTEFGGSYGPWGTAYGREYKATFVRPDFHAVEMRVAELRAALQDALDYLRKERKHEVK